MSYYKLMISKSLALILIFLCLLLFFLHIVAVDSQRLQSQEEEVAILLRLKRYWQDPAWPSTSHWNASNNASSSTHHCLWRGITCRNGSVTGLALSSVNVFRSTIPPFICDLKNVTYLDLSLNYFHGEFPRLLYNCSKLTHLDLSENSFSGPIPSDIDRMVNIQTLKLSYNKFSSIIPATIGRLEALQLLELSNNLLTGTLPDSIFSLKNLRKLYLSMNSLSGKIPEVVTAFNLTVIDLSQNLLTGTLPDSIFSLKNLRKLYLSMNSLSGKIPEFVTAFNLTVIDLSLNYFQGKIPQSFGKLEKLSVLSLRMNQLSGEIPNSIGRLPALTTILLYMNDFSGTLPPDLGRYSPVIEFQVFSNRFTGALPNNLCFHRELATLQVSENDLSGELPESLSNCSSLVTLRIDSNGFSGTIPDQANWRRLSTVDISKNRFYGKIPAGISSWKNLEYFRGSNNQLSGLITEEIASLPFLSYLDLSENQLSGPIPIELAHLRLFFLNLSSNHLVGKVPRELAKHGRESFLNNPGLISLSEFSSKVKILIASASVVAAACLGALLIYILVAKLCSNKAQKKVPLTWKFIPFHVLNFRESNILLGMIEHNVVGHGGSGKVYRVQLDFPDECVAVKRIISNNRKLDQNLEKQFLAEVEILGKIRHLNIVKLLCCISSESSMLLVYEYMENRSLDYWLHRNKWESSFSGSSGDLTVSLDWPKRLKIAIGAAQGLCYMHDHCSPPIIHRDVKSGNILLDAEFNAKVADFGLARLLPIPGEANTASVVAGSFGYIAPEYAQTKRLNEKVDVYSFGVVLLELTTGKKANAGDEYTGLAQWAWRLMQEGDLQIPDALDEDIRESPDHLEEMIAVFKLGIYCTGMLPSARPSMKEVLQILLSFH